MKEALEKFMNLHVPFYISEGIKKCNSCQLLLVNDEHCATYDLAKQGLDKCQS